jgi:Tfp pilus assembly protein PilN
MSGMNLLPPCLTHKQQTRRLVFWLACTQGVIVFILASALWLLIHFVEQATLSTDTLDHLLAEERFIHPDRVAELLNSHIQSEIDFSFETVPFNITWLAEINRTQPGGVGLSTIEINGPQITLLCLAENWNDASFFRDALQESDVFDEARFGTFEVMDDGFIHFELYLWAVS